MTCWISLSNNLRSFFPKRKYKWCIKDDIFDRVFGFLRSIYHLLQNFKSNFFSQKRQWNSQIFFSGCISSLLGTGSSSSRSYHCCLLPLNHVCILAYIECQCQTILIRKHNHHFKTWYFFSNWASKARKSYQNDHPFWNIFVLRKTPSNHSFNLKTIVLKF